ncbi:MAG: SMI1/KNR4 family protein [Methylophilaceae bacterium]
MTPYQIEAKYQFKYPALYHQLFADGMLDVGKKGPNWVKNEYPKRKEFPLLLLYAEDFELLDMEEVVARIEDFANPDDYRRADRKHKFIPFGQSGAGDLICFYLNAQVGDDIPIVFVWHDDDKAYFKAKNLQDYIFAKLLEVTLNPYDLKAEAEAVFKHDLNNMLKSHRAYILPYQADIVAEVYSRKFVNYTITYPRRTEQARGLITEDEYKKIIAAENKFDNAEQFFAYALPELIIVETEENKRHVGVLQIKISPIPAEKSPIWVMLKPLNWRGVRDASSNTYTSTRSMIIFGPPSMQTLDDTFRGKLAQLKQDFPEIELIFIENKTQTLI